MTYIQHLTAKNLKIPSLALALYQLTVIQGRNGSGKTTIVDAIQLAGLGYVPRIGKTGPALASLCGSGLELSVSAKLSNGSEILRSWKRTEKGMSKVESPDDTGLPVYSLDPEYITGLSPDSLAHVIATRFGVEGDPIATITAEVQKKLGKLPFPSLNKAARESFSTWLAAVEASLSESLKEQRATAKRMKTTLEGLSALEEFPPEIVAPEVLTAADEATGAARARLTAADKAVADLRTVVLQAEDHVPAPELSRAALDEEKTGLERDIAALESQRKAAEDAAARLQTTADLVAKLRDRLESIEHWLDNNPAQEEPAKPAPGPTPAEVSAAIKKATEAAMMLSGLKANAAALESMQLTGTVCECCGAKAEHWDTERQWNAEAKLVEAREAVAKAEKSVTSAEAIRDDLEAKAEEARKATAARAAWEAWSKEHAQYMARQSETSASLVDAEKRMEDVPLFSEEQAANLFELNQSLETVNAELAQWDEHEASQRRLELINEYRAKVKAADEEQNAAALAAENAEVDAKTIRERAEASAKYIAAKKTRDDAEKAHTEADEEVKAWDAARDTLREEAAKVTEKIFKPLLALAGPIADDCLPSPLSHRGLEFGRWDGAHFITLATFSKSEREAAIAGITAALAAAGRGIVIIDEFSTMDDAKRRLMLRNLGQAIEAGTISQAIVLDNSGTEYTLPAFGGVVKLA